VAWLKVGPIWRFELFVFSKTWTNRVRSANSMNYETPVSPSSYCSNPRFLVESGISLDFGDVLLKTRAIFLPILFCARLLDADSAVIPPQAIVEKYWAAVRGQAQALDGSSMDVEIRASLPKLKQHGRFQALRRISRLGRITYEHAVYDGAELVKKQVILRFMTAEVEAQATRAQSLAVTPNNYNFKYKRDEQLDDRTAHVFAVTPKKKKEGLFKGEIWIDADSYLELQESGSLVKNPSLIIKRVSFVKRNAIRDGVAVPLQLETVTETRGFGQAQLYVDYSNFTPDPDQSVAQALDDR